MPKRPYFLVLIFFFNICWIYGQDTHTIFISINADSDDVEESSGGVIDINSTDIELVEDGGDSQTVGLRFNNINIPVGSTINTAYIQFYSDDNDTDSETTSVLIEGELLANPPTFSTATNDISSRDRTNEKVPWNNIPAWNNFHEATAAQKTPDLSAIVQEIIDLQDWTANNSMAFIITGSGQRTAEVYNDYPDLAAVLEINYTEPFLGLSLSVTGTDISCFGANNGTATANITNGSGNYSYEWDNNEMMATIDGLSPGNYFVTITDEDTQEMLNGSVMINEPDALSIDLFTTNTSTGNNGAAFIQITGGIPDYAIEWPDGSTNFDICGLSEGSYEVSVTDANNCLATAIANIQTSNDCPAEGTPCSDCNPNTLYDVQDGNCSCTGAVVIASTIVRGPYLQKGTPSSISVKWRTSNSTNSKVWFGTSPDALLQTIEVPDLATEHEVAISDLSPNTTYYYAIGDDNGIMEGGNEFHFFKTAPPISTTQPIRAWVLGDCGTGNSSADAVRDAYYNYAENLHTDLVLLLGDNAYNDGTDSEYQAAIFDTYTSMLKKSVFWSCPGNHDTRSASSPDQSGVYYDIFTFPTAGEAGGMPSNTEAYYSFDYGNIHFISLDSDDSDRSVTGNMLMWLENDLAATLQDWIVVIFHHPPYTKGSHDSDDVGDSSGRMRDMRENVLPILESYGVDLVLSGHSHAYERSHLISGHYDVSNTFDPNTMLIDGGDGRVDGDGVYEQMANGDGTVYIVTGSAGKLGGMDPIHPVMYYAVARLGSTILEVDGGIMDIKFLNSSGVVEDYLTLTKDVSPRVHLNWLAPTDNAVFGNLDPIELSVSAVSNSGTITAVEFFVDDVSIGTDNTAPYTFSWTPPDYGTYTLRADAVDDNLLTDSKTINIEVTNEIIIMEMSQINNNDDDAEEQDGTVNFTSSDLELCYEGGVTPQVVGLHFRNIDVPRGANITQAYIQFTSDDQATDDGTTDLLIKAENVDNAAPFENTASNISSRTPTNNEVPWSPVPWNTLNVATVDQQTPDLKDIVTEVTNRSGWQANNSMTFMITGTGERTAESHNEFPSRAAKLVIFYVQGTGGCPPLGTICDDGNPNTANDEQDGNCNCIGTPTYCTPIHTNPENELITNVSLHTINNNSGGWNTSIPGISDFTNISTTLTRNVSYTIDVNSNLSWADSKLGIWADWNNDFSFNNNEEKLADLSGTGPWTANFTVPETAEAGATIRLRVRLSFGPDAPDPCNAYGYTSGETEDYSLQIAVPLALNDLNFDAIAKKEGIELFWSYPEETPLLGYEIQRSEDGQHFGRLAWQEAQNSNNEIKHYTYLDDNIIDNQRYYYRLLVVPDGAASFYSDIKNVNWTSTKSGWRFLPNPTEDSGYLHFEKVPNGPIDVRIYNAAGQKVKTVLQNAYLEKQVLAISFGELPKGLYFLKVESKNGIESLKVVKQ